MSAVSAACSAESFQEHWKSFHCLIVTTFLDEVFELIVEQQH